MTPTDPPVPDLRPRSGLHLAGDGLSSLFFFFFSTHVFGQACSVQYGYCSRPSCMYAGPRRSFFLPCFDRCLSSYLLA